MSLFHFHVGHVKRSAGQSAVASAAYRSGEDLYSEYYGERNDYTRKGGVVLSEIFLPENAPPEYEDRQVLWNAVEKAEHGKKAQLAYSFDIALQNELTMDENIELAEKFVTEQFVARGMIADLAVHKPDDNGSGISNPHFHVMCPIRPLDENGKWGAKQRRVYRTDENGERIMGSNGKALFDAVPTTDWGSPETLEMWRQKWADMCNEKFEEKGLECRIDNRSYMRQGAEILPTVHEGVTVKAMEKKGMKTDKGSFNRWIKETNAMIQELRDKLAEITGWIQKLREELTKQQAPGIVQLMGDYYDERDEGAYSRKARTGNLKEFAENINYLEDRNIHTFDDLYADVDELSSRVDELRESMDNCSRRMKEVKELLYQVQFYSEHKHVNDELQKIKFKGRREKFEQDHDGELKLFRMARRKLKDYVTPEGKLPVKAWENELKKLERQKKEEYPRYKALREELTKLQKIKYSVERSRDGLERDVTRQRKRSNSIEL